MSKKITLLLSIFLIGALLLAGCVRNTPYPSPTLTPGTTPLTSVAPLATPTPATLNPGSTTSPGTQVSPAPWPSAGAGASASDLENAKKIEGELDKMTEVQSSTVLVHGGKALVGVKFDNAYRGELTSRITDMITEKAKAVDPSVTDVVVSDDPAMIEDIKEMRSRLDGGNLMTDIKAEFEKLIQRVKPAV